MMERFNNRMKISTISRGVARNKRQVSQIFTAKRLLPTNSLDFIRFNERTLHLISLTDPHYASD